MWNSYIALHDRKWVSHVTSMITPSAVTRYHHGYNINAYSCFPPTYNMISCSFIATTIIETFDYIMQNNDLLHVPLRNRHNINNSMGQACPTEIPGDSRGSDGGWYNQSWRGAEFKSNTVWLTERGSWGTNVQNYQYCSLSSFGEWTSFCIVPIEKIFINYYRPTELFMINVSYSNQKISKITWLRVFFHKRLKFKFFPNSSNSQTCANCFVVSKIHLDREHVSSQLHTLQQLS